MNNEDIFDGLISEENVPESNWFKFEKVGDTVMGILVEVKDKPAVDVFPAQRVFTLKQKNGELMNVGIPNNDSPKSQYLLGRTRTAKLGDALGFSFVKEVPSATKGFAPAKSIEVYVKHLETAVDEDPTK